MELEKFISTTLTSIVSGVKNANKLLYKEQFVIYNKDENCVEFDVAVTVSEGKTEVIEGVIGGGLLGLLAKISSKGLKSKSDTSISRLKFRIKPRVEIK
jgi:hypothetical protein